MTNTSTTSSKMSSSRTVWKVIFWVHTRINVSKWVERLNSILRAPDCANARTYRPTLLGGGAETAWDAALKIVRQKRVEERIETAVDVGETGARYLDDHQPRRHRHGAVLDDERDVKRQPAERKDGDNDNHHSCHAAFRQRRLATCYCCCCWCR